MRRCVVLGLAASVVAATAATAPAAIITFQQGVGGYAGTQDTELRQADPNTPRGDQTSVSIDGLESNPPPSATQVLIRFDGIFGNGPGQIPLGSVINSATLTVQVTSPGSGINVHRMLVDWNEATATWNFFGGNGVQANGVEAVAVADTVVGANNATANVPNGPLALNVTAGVAAWSAGAANFGFALLPFPNGTNGIDFPTSEFATVGLRPLLSIDFTPPGAVAVPAPPSVVLAGCAAVTGLVARRFRRR